MPVQTSLRSSPRILYFLAAGGIILILLRLYWERGAPLPDPVPPRPQDEPDHLLCRDLPGAEDIVVALKTGATEVQDKLSVHLQTTLRCYPNHLVFSSYEEVYEGQPIIDALSDVSPSIQESHPDFEIWRRLRKDGRAALSSEELSGQDSKEIDEGLRKQNPAWVIDKWKFLPMMNRTLHEYPSKQWYVFVEADTYIFWSNLVANLSALSREEPHYIGSEITIEDVRFAYGGAGFALSHVALQRVVVLFRDAKAEWEDYTERYWAGDHILAAALLEVDVELENSWPSWQGESHGLFNYQPAFRANPWCELAISYHHESPYEVEDLWNFEQEWVSEQVRLSEGGQAPRLLRHRDVFERYLLPRIQQPRMGWDNTADTPRGSAASLKECEAICEADPTCLQFALRLGDQCTTTAKPFFGEVADGVESGWMPQRLQQYFNNKEEC